MWRLSSEPIIFQLASPTEDTPDHHINWPNTSLFSFYVLCKQLFFSKYCIFLTSYVEVKTVNPTLNCFFVYVAGNSGND
jgi:hypothetical protein